MDEPKNIQRLSEVEFCLTRYFHTHFVPVMNRTKNELQEAQTKEIKEYNNSLSGILRSLANASRPAVMDDTLPYLQITGKHCSKTAEDYVEMCVKQIISDGDFQSDLQQLANEWREVVVAEVGRERYDILSAKLGTDLASAYVDHRMEQMMIDRMVNWQMPKSSFEYILRKGTSSSLFGLQQEIMKSPLQQHIEAQAEIAYHPSQTEKVTAKGATVLMDAVAMGGVYSWGTLAGLATTEVAFSGLESIIGNEEEKKVFTVEECVSQAVFKSQRNIFPAIREKSGHIHAYENEYIQEVDEKMIQKMAISTMKPIWMPELKTEQNTKRIADVPLVIAPGHEQEWLELEAERKRETVNVSSTITAEHDKGQPIDGLTPQETINGKEKMKNVEQQDGWGLLLQSVGLDGLGDIGRNLPYVIATLPDMLIGLLTGKTTSISLKKEMIPIASVLLGLFVRNPMLKLLLIGMGGANLLNKVGHEAICRKTDTVPQQIQYKIYADEELNPRIVNPVFQGNTLVATIDHIPCSVILPDHVAQAYQSGALPLNTLANAILLRYDQSDRLVPENNRNVEMDADKAQERERNVILR